MGRTKIEWVKNQDGSQGYTINPVKGLCPMACSYCYARAMYKRFKWNPEIRFDDLWIPDLANIKKPSRIFVGSTMELFGEWVKYWWLKTVFDFTLLYPQHTFIFLTKRPQNLITWSPFPSNVWVGVSATNANMLFDALNYLDEIQCEKRFVSIEPMLESCHLEDLSAHLAGTLDWLIIGARTPYSKRTAPKIEWVREIVKATDKAGIPVFVKDNMRPLFETPTGILRGRWWTYKGSDLVLRQEFPNAK